MFQDDAAEMCSMSYRPPELFSVDGHSAVDERTDIWVGVGNYNDNFYSKNCILLLIIIISFHTKHLNHYIACSCVFWSDISGFAKNSVRLLRYSCFSFSHMHNLLQ